MRFKAWAIGKVLIVVASLGANLWTLAQQGMQHWLESLFHNGKLQVLWLGSPSRTNVSVQAKTDHGDTIVLHMGERISLPAGRYALSVFQSGNFRSRYSAKTEACLPMWRLRHFTLNSRWVRFAPADPPFAQMYDDVADHVGRPVSGGKRQPRVY
jgi:hypothetical protein